jgi:hypothetical protein
VQRDHVDVRVALPPESEESYIRWFSWAMSTSASDRSAAHAAAAVVCLAELGGTLEFGQFENLAKLVLESHRAASDRFRALAEWSYWAQHGLGASSGGAVRAARQALAALDAGADLAVATAVAKAALFSEPTVASSIDATANAAEVEPQYESDFDSNTTTAAAEAALPVEVVDRALDVRSNQLHPASRPSPRIVASSLSRRWLWLIPIALALILTVVAVANITSPLLNPLLNPTVGADGSVHLGISGFPSQTEVIFIVNRVAIASTTTDSHGGGSAVWVPTYDPGTSLTIEACLDLDASNCLAHATVIVK